MHKNKMNAFKAVNKFCTVNEIHGWNTNQVGEICQNVGGQSWNVICGVRRKVHE